MQCRLAKAWPASWYAITSFSESEIILDLFWVPSITLSFASSKSSIVTIFLFFLAAIKAASFTILAKSAPEKPGVDLAMAIVLTDLSILIFLVWTFKILSLPIMSGVGTTTCLSNLPGLSKAGSRTSGLLVAATIITPSLASKPSISTNSWLRVCSLSSLPPPRPAPRCLPTASISSINIIQGAFFFPCSNISLTRLAPTPTNISTKSEPDIEKNGTPASPAIALANKVLPVPGGPTNKAPFGIFAPNLWNLWGSFKKDTTSSSSCLASSIPATSPKVTLSLFSFNNLAFERPNPKAPPPLPDCIWRIKKIQTPINKSIGNQETNMLSNGCIPDCSGLAFIATPLSLNVSIRLGSLGA